METGMSTRGTKERIRAKSSTGSRAAVTVVILCYNYGHFLPEATGSAMSQVGVDVNVVIVDDKSTDDSVHIARELASAHPGVISVVQNATNLGLVGAFNVGLAAATGEFIVRIDADDLLTPGALRRAVDVARAFPTVGLIYGRPLHFRGSVLPTPRTRATHWTVWPGLAWLEGRCRGGHNVMTSPEVMMRRSIVEVAGPIRQLPHTNDMEMWLRMAAHADIAYIHGADQAWHRDHEASMSEREVDDLLDLRERAEAFEVLFGESELPVPSTRYLHGLAKITLANHAILSASHEIDCGRSDKVSAYLEFAGTLVESPQELQGWPGLERRRKKARSRSTSVVMANFRRLHRRIKSELRWHRWRRTGVF